MQMVGALNAVLLHARKAELASATDPTREANADQASDAEVIAAAGAQSHDAANAFVPANVRQLDLCDGIAVCTGGGAAFGVEVCVVTTISRCISNASSFSLICI